MTYPYITAEDLGAFLSTTLSADALRTIIEDVAQEIDDRFGPVGVDVTEYLSPELGRRSWTGDRITLRRKPASITSVVEWLDTAGDSTRTLDPTDYRITGYVVERLSGGTTPAWGWSSYGLVVTYRPIDDSERRAMAIVDVARLETSPVASSGGTLTSRRIGDYSESFGGGGGGSSSSSSGGSIGLESARTKLLRHRLAARHGFVMR